MIRPFFIILFLTGCQSTPNVVEHWQDLADQSTTADMITVQGLSEKVRLLDVVLVSQATEIPWLGGDDCREPGTQHFKQYFVRHRFRVKPGQIKISIAALPHPDADPSCEPKLREIRIDELHYNGSLKQKLARVVDLSKESVDLKFSGRIAKGTVSSIDE